jgi:hypothetical protein
MGIRSLSTASISTGVKRSKVWDQSAVVQNNSFESISTVALGTATSSISFTSIPSTYKHLQIRYIARTDRTSSSDGDYLIMRFNDLSGASDYYTQHYVRGNGSATYAASDGTYSALTIERMPCSTQGSNIFGGGVIDILDYTNTNKNKVMRHRNGSDWNGSGMVRLASGMLMSTPAITKITVAIGAGTNIVAGSHFALYGIKG